MTVTCPHCGNEDESMVEEVGFSAARAKPMSFKGIPLFPDNPAYELALKRLYYNCTVCSKEFTVEAQMGCN